jgi:hypothetical protein
MEHREIEHRTVAGGMQPDLPVRTQQPARQQRGGDPERLQHVEGRRMEGRGPQIAHDAGLGLDNRHGYLLLGEQQCGAEPDRPTAGDDHFGIAAMRHRGRT